MDKPEDIKKAEIIYIDATHEDEDIGQGGF